MSNKWYDILIIPYLSAVKKYHEYEKLRNYKFEQIFFRTLDNARSNYWRNMNRKKRCPEGGIYSFEALRVDKNRKIIEKLQDISKKYTMEEKISDRMDIQSLIGKLEQHDLRKVVYMLLDGYCGTDIQRILKVSSYKYREMVKKIRSTLSEYI